MKTMILTEETVTQVFPGTNPSIASGEEGFIAYGFNRIYPQDLAIFCPLEFPRSRISSAFPQDFENSFRNLDAEIAHLSRLHEIDLSTNFDGFNVEFMIGHTVRRPGFDAKYTVFQFDCLDGPRICQEALCRIHERDLKRAVEKRGARAELSWNVGLLNTNYRYYNSVRLPGGEQVEYWIMPISSLFTDTNQLIAAVFMMSLAHL